MQYLASRIPALWLLAISVFLIHGAPGHAAMKNHTSAEEAILMDYDTGQVLFKKNAHRKMPTASMSKLMTLYMVFWALEADRISMDDTFRVSRKSWEMGGSQMFLEVDDQVSVEDLIHGVIVHSGNDAALTLAEGVGGTEKSFVKAMNDKANELGMDNSHFANASGLPDPDHYSTAHDLALLARATIKNFPEYYKLFDEKEFTYNNIKQSNRNPLLYRDIGADGLKTGHTKEAGYGLIASGKQDGRRAILVLNGLPSEKARAQEGARLLEWGLKGFDNVKLYVAEETVVKAPVVLGHKNRVPLMLSRDVTVTVPKIARDELKVMATYTRPLKAPVERGKKVGTLKVHIPKGETREYPLKTAQKVEGKGFFAKTLAKIQLALTSTADPAQAQK
jgi:D-alanyl-D-alanine carboxypeptidase (penicillin-binding protein 5/6)